MCPLVMLSEAQSLMSLPSITGAEELACVMLTERYRILPGIKFFLHITVGAPKKKQSWNIIKPIKQTM